MMIFYWRQKSNSLNVVQYNTSSKPIIIHLQIYIALPENLINRATLEYVPGLTHILLSITYNQFFFFFLIKQRTLPRTRVSLNSKAHQLGWLKTKYAEFFKIRTNYNCRLFNHNGVLSRWSKKIKTRKGKNIWTSWKGIPKHNTNT